MSSYKTVAVAGATGNLGPTLVHALADAGFEVTLLSRSNRVTADIAPKIKKVIQVDYTSVASLTTALAGQDALVSNVPNHGSQKPLIDAAIAAGVKRILPSEFGVDVYGDRASGDMPLYKEGKVEIQRYLAERKEQIGYTYVVTGLFLDWDIKMGLQIDPKGKTQLYDGGNKKFSDTLLSDIGKAVVGILKHPDETKDRAVCVQSTSVSQQELLEIAKKVRPDFKAETKNVSTAELAAQGYAMVEKNEDLEAAFFKFTCIIFFGEPYKMDWTGHIDNELFGIKELSRDELAKVVESYM